MALFRARDFFPKKKKKNKYNAVKTVVNGDVCDSKLEGDHYRYLLSLQSKGEIGQINFHPKWDIVINGEEACSVSLDFSFYDINQRRWRYVDSKGVYNSESRLRHKLLNLTHGIPVEIWTKDSWGI